MTEREALKLALEALERVNTVDDDCDILAPSLADAVGEAIDVIKEALAQPEREIDPSTTFDEVAKGLQVSRMAIAALDALTIEQRRSINEPLLKAQLFLKAAARVFKEALAQPEQEPVAVVAEVHMSRYTIEWTNGPLPEGTKLYTTPYVATPRPQRTPLTDEIPKGVLLAISNAGLTLLKTQHGYELRKLGPAVAHGIKE